MTEFNLSKKIRLAEHNAYGNKVIPLEDVKEFIRRLKRIIKKGYGNQASFEFRAIIDQLAGDELI